MSPICLQNQTYISQQLKPNLREWDCIKDDLEAIKLKMSYKLIGLVNNFKMYMTQKWLWEKYFIFLIHSNVWNACHNLDNMEQKLIWKQRRKR